MRDELDDHPEDYRSLTYEYLCDLLSTIEVKDESKRAAAHIKKIASARAESLSDSDKSVIIPSSKTGVLSSNKSPRRENDRHYGAQRHCVLLNKAGIPECKYESHGSDDYTGVRNKRSIKDVIGGPIGSRTHAVQHHKKSEKNGRRIWRPSRSRKRCYIELPRNLACAVKSRTSRISGQNLLRRLASLPVRIGITIIQWPAIVAEINTYGLLDVRR